MESRSARGSTRTATIRPSHAANRPQTDHHGELVLVRGQRHLVERMGHVRAQEADLVEAVCPEEVDRVGDDVGDPR
eukprot:9546933-Alexandrium_andersonii.AAC.1